MTALLTATVAAAARGRVLPARVRAAVDATGFDGRVVSRYFTSRAGRRIAQRKWPKLTAAVDTATHLILAAAVTRGPTQDARHLVPAVRAAARRVRVDTVLADAGYDSEANHAVPRTRLGVRSTVIALNRRGTRKRPKAEYRRQMVRRFRKRPRGTRSKRVYGQRWQAESGFSRLKRVLGSTVRAVTWANQRKELLLRCITYNLMLLAGQT